MNEQYPDNNFVQNEVSNVDATIGKEFLLKSVVALVAACVLILLYVAYRFRKIGGLKAGSTPLWLCCTTCSSSSASLSSCAFL